MAGERLALTQIFQTEATIKGSACQPRQWQL